MKIRKRRRKKRKAKKKKKKYSLLLLVTDPTIYGIHQMGMNFLAIF